MQKQLFRQYDIRGKIGTEIAIDDFYYLAHAVIAFLKKQGDCHAIVLGMDGRIHSQAIFQQIAAAAKIAGVDLYFLGICSTPITTFSDYQLPVQASLMITASHNPSDYNGLKISYKKMAIEGGKLQQIYDLFSEKVVVQGDVSGQFFDYSHMVDQYIDHLIIQFSHLKEFKHKTIIDCGNGTAGPILEKLIAKMGWSHVELLFSEVDGNYPNHTADPTDIKNLKILLEQLQERTDYFGIALDGDCDRVSVITGRQGLLSADKLLTIFALDMQAKVVVADIKSSSVIAFSQAEIILAATGCAHIKASMEENAALLAGELSGHFFFKDRHIGYDDGMYAMLRFFEILMIKNIKCDDLIATLPETFTTKDIRIPCADSSKFVIVDEIKAQLLKENVYKMTTIDGVRFEKNDSWGLIRAANTQPMLSICCQASSPEQLQDMKKILITLLQPYVELQLLQQYIV